MVESEHISGGRVEYPAITFCVDAVYAWKGNNDFSEESKYKSHIESIVILNPPKIFTNALKVKLIHWMKLSSMQLVKN